MVENCYICSFLCTTIFILETFPRLSIAVSFYEENRKKLLHTHSPSLNLRLDNHEDYSFLNRSKGHHRLVIQFSIEITLLLNHPPPTTTSLQSTLNINPSSSRHSSEQIQYQKKLCYFCQKFRIFSQSNSSISNTSNYFILCIVWLKY